MKKFESLISPIAFEDFFANFWRKKLLYVTKSITENCILSELEIDQYFARHILSYPFVRMVGQGSEIDFKRYQLDEGNTFKIINKDSLFSLFNEGNTIVIQAAHFQFNKLNEYVANIEKELGIDINANIYITPSNSSGFHPHFDTHEVIILQISGSKKWNIYDIPSVAPIKNWGLTQQQRDHYINSNPTHQLTMEEGDILYLPRGVVHDAYCVNDMSIHITFGFNEQLNLDILNETMKLAEKDVFFRESFNNRYDFNLEEAKSLIINKFSNLLEQAISAKSPYMGYKTKYKNTNGIFKALCEIDCLNSIDELIHLNLEIDEEVNYEFSKDEMDVVDFVKDFKIVGESIKAFDDINIIKSVLKNSIRKNKIKIQWNLQ